VPKVKTRQVAAAIVLLSLSVAGGSQVRVTVDHNTGPDATRDFKFKRVPSPAKDDAAAKGKLTMVVGRQDPNGAGLSALSDGVLPVREDQPRANFFFDSDSDGGRFLIDLGSAIEIAQVNTYSWHPNTRGPQVYNLFVSDGTDSKFNPAPDGRTDPRSCGWKLIASVDTRPTRGDSGGQYGVSITDARGSLGKFRYLLFDSVPTETDDPSGNTFYSEVDVVAKE
jgi:hypothetical protein